MTAHASPVAATLIESAIEKLNADRAKSTPGRWSRTDELWEGSRRWEIESPEGMVTSDGDGIGSLGNIHDADLIVTLHATIDAQIGVLTRAYNMAVTGREAVTVVEMNLARAIVGTDS